MDNEKIGRALVEITYICDDFKFSDDEILTLAEEFLKVVKKVK